MMLNNKRISLVIAIVFVSVLIPGMFYSYQRDKKWLKAEGVYVVGTVCDIRVARNGWKVTRRYEYSKIRYNNYGLYSWEYFNRHSIGKKYFIRLAREDPDYGGQLVPIMEVPDSLLLVPNRVWSEQWMKVHFPKVVEYAHKR
ncbi:hypothetical protein CAP35_12345 [Chitinophagaceae bacterium IBVUCB1]|nr:hypothetical protein CAP35_12345 [Chitinophagaceae bacterium IBVUCB1]